MRKAKKGKKKRNNKQKHKRHKQEEGTAGSEPNLSNFDLGDSEKENANRVGLLFYLGTACGWYG